ncbi:hypothetical protein BaRGS_00014282 [Batillaria attramentaria]|uniref:Uncharacterized protein n=1 Tax=Batillaria attramentaria TaxID=370345 RepID=A0ABD0L4L9_9CAEN
MRWELPAARSAPRGTCLARAGGVPRYGAQRFAGGGRVTVVDVAISCQRIYLSVVGNRRGSPVMALWETAGGSVVDEGKPGSNR